MTQVTSGLQAAGNIDIEVLRLLSSTNVFVDLNDYLIELNIFEDLFSPTLHGTIMLSDSRNLPLNLFITGQELLMVKLTTPTLGVSIEKTFRVFSITDRVFVRDTNTQTYILHFCSQEAVLDSLIPIYQPFDGKITDVVSDIYTKYLSVPRNMILRDNKFESSEETTGLTIVNDTENSVSYISPGWSPIRNLNWLASKATPKEGKGANFLFWETTRSFYFGSIDYILKQYKEKEIVFGRYVYTAADTRDQTIERPKGSDVNKEIFNIESIEIIDQFDELSKYRDGYYANSVYAFDINRKSLEIYQYDHVQSFEDYSHTEQKNVASLNLKNAARNPESVRRLVSKGKYLFNGKANNVNEVNPSFWGNRRSNLKDISNMRMNIVVSGRTDIESGMTIYISVPTSEPRSQEDFSKSNEDPYMSGIYLITAIRHKITLINHSCIMEVAKDSINLEDR